MKTMMCSHMAIGTNDDGDEDVAARHLGRDERLCTLWYCRSSARAGSTMMKVAPRMPARLSEMDADGMMKMIT